MNATASPIHVSERIPYLDIIRGFALLGILIMNIEYFQRPMQAIMLGFDNTQVGADFAVGWFSYTFVQGKFYTMFSLLFGMGFIIFLDRAKEKVGSPRWLFSRRILILAIFGMAHGFLIWSGDILLTYSVVGFVVLLFANRSAKSLLRWGIVLLIIPPLLMWLGAFGMNFALQSSDGPTILAEMAKERALLDADILRGVQIYSEGAWSEAVRWRIYEMSQLYLGAGLLFFVLQILAIFLIGASFARSGLFNGVDKDATRFKKMAALGYLIGLPSALFVGTVGLELDMMMPTYHSAQVFTLMAVANMALCLAYISTLVLLVNKGVKVVQWLAPAGRMALTNYLMQSIVFTFIFYGYGLGFYGEIGRAMATVMGLMLYIGQIAFSNWWLQRYHYGPAEWLWRALTYGQRPSFVKAAT
ncbi:MAG: DUF418 domain-containing protein [Idiomarina sp.]|nr:DUF418 domain-containing protein [Idiomarina sp.]